MLPARFKNCYSTLLNIIMIQLFIHFHVGHGLSYNSENIFERRSKIAADFSIIIWLLKEDATLKV